MGILDDAIREHLDLKRKHGARDSELREIQDEALGSGERPDPFAAGDLFGEVGPSAEPEGGGRSQATAPQMGEAGIGGEEPTRLVESAGVEPVIPDEPVSPPEGLRQLPGQEQLPAEEFPGDEQASDQLAEPQAPAEPEPPVEGVEPPAPSESLEELLAQEEEPEASAAPPPETAEREAPVERERPLTPPPATEEHEAEPESPEAGEPAAPPETQEPEAPPPEPKSSVPEPPPPPPPDTGPEPPGRARGRVDVPTQEHPPPSETGEGAPIPAAEPDELEPLDEGRPLDLAPSEDTPLEESPLEEPPLDEARPPERPEAGGPQLYDFETDEEALEPTEFTEPASETDDDFEALGPAEEEAPYVEEEEPYAAEEPSTGTEEAPEAADDEEFEGWSEGEEARQGDTEDDLWFEKGPPQDFDFEE
jgi:hypothetical protein